jgi:UDP-N-acetylmuramate--alanine ligase
MFGKIKHIYFVGIGGAGMCGIAEILVSLGYKVSGSDKQATDVTMYLEKIGVAVYEGHIAENVLGADALVYSSAVPKSNPELMEAKKLKIPVIRRAEMLGELMRMKYGISIAGTHGKTTTTSMVGTILTEGGLDPTIIVGGKLQKLQTNARLGKSKFLVAEADEFDRSFLTLTSSIAVITTLDVDHLDCYKDLDDIKNAFVMFANKVPFFGAVIVCIDEPSVQDILPRLERKVITYGVSKQAELRATAIQYTNGKSSFNVLHNGKNLGEVIINLPGLHNIKNALASVAIGIELEMSFKNIANGLKLFEGVGRRFEVKANVNDILIVDDYAHHPTEIMASLQGAKTGWINRRIIAVFQPHLYSRTRDFHEEFGKSFFDSDYLILTDVYPAREEPIEGITGELIAADAREFGHRNVEYIQDKHKIADQLHKIVKAGDLVITMGAGDIHKFGMELKEKLEKNG